MLIKEYLEVKCADCDWRVCIPIHDIDTIYQEKDAIVIKHFIQEHRISIGNYVWQYHMVSVMPSIERTYKFATWKEVIIDPKQHSDLLSGS